MPGSQRRAPKPQESRAGGSPLPWARQCLGAPADGQAQAGREEAGGPILLQQQCLAFIVPSYRHQM